MKLPTRLLSVAVIACGAITGCAVTPKSDHQYSPADFGLGASSVLGGSVALAFPVDATTAIEVMCQASINSDGISANAHCIAPREFHFVGDAVAEAITKATFLAATVDGEAVTVQMNMMAVVACVEAEACTVAWRANHGRFDEHYGRDYSAPQPIIESDGWYEKYPDKLEWIESRRSIYDFGGATFLVSAQVDETGRARDNRVDFVVPNHHRHWWWAAETSSSLRKVRFIPGQVRGESTSMRVYEYWLDTQDKGGEVFVANGIPLNDSYRPQDRKRRIAGHDVSYLTRSVWYGIRVSDPYNPPKPPR